jgi:hypothetical protein
VAWWHQHQHKPDCVFAENEEITCMCSPQLNRISRVCECALYMCECVCCYYFADPSTVSVCRSVHVRCPDACIYNAEVLSMCNKHLMLGQTPVVYTHTYTHSRTFNTFTQAQYSVNSHAKHTHSHKRGKPGKNAGWQGRQLVVVQQQPPVSRRNKELDRQLSCLLRKANKTNTHTHTHTHTHTQFT